MLGQIIGNCLLACRRHRIREGLRTGQSGYRLRHRCRVAELAGNSSVVARSITNRIDGWRANSEGELEIVRAVATGYALRGVKPIGGGTAGSTASGRAMWRHGPDSQAIGLRHRCRVAELAGNSSVVARSITNRIDGWRANSEGELEIVRAVATGYALRGVKPIGGGTAGRAEVIFSNKK